MTAKSSCSEFVIQNALLAARFSKRISHRLSVHGISLSEYLVLDYLNNTLVNEVPRIELAEYLGMSASGVTRLIAPMEKIGLVKRAQNPRDARQSLVTLTKTGKKLYQDASTSFEFISDDLLGMINVSDQDRLLKLYKKLI